MELRYTESLPIFMTGLVNIKKANTKQYQWLYEHGCSHRHRYTTHFNCFLKEFNIQEKIGFLDIETSNLKANFGIVLCWCLLDDNGDLYKDAITKKDVSSGYEDKRIIQSCIDTMMKFDRVVTHYGTYFDIPFLRTRAVIHKLKFPEYGSLYHTDVWKMAKSKLCLHSNRQNIIAESLFGKTIKTRIDHSAWRGATMGNADAVNKVIKHCEYDVEELKNNFRVLLPFTVLNRTSI